jgi:hypothetical protein
VIERSLCAICKRCPRSGKKLNTKTTSCHRLTRVAGEATGLSLPHPPKPLSQIDVVNLYILFTTSVRDGARVRHKRMTEPSSTKTGLSFVC